MQRIVLMYGLLAGALTYALTYLVIAIDGDFSSATPDHMAVIEWFGYSRYLLLALGVIMAMYTYKKNTAGPVGYGRVFLVGALVAVVAGVFVGVMEYVYVAYTDPDFYDHYVWIMIERMKQEGASAAKLEEMRQEMASYDWVRSPAATGAFYFVNTAVIGAILAAIAAIFMRRKVDTSSDGMPLGEPA